MSNDPKVEMQTLKYTLDSLYTSTEQLYLSEVAIKRLSFDDRIQEIACEALWGTMAKSGILNGYISCLTAPNLKCKL